MKMPLKVRQISPGRQLQTASSDLASRTGCGLESSPSSWIKVGWERVVENVEIIVRMMMWKRMCVVVTPVLIHESFTRIMVCKVTQILHTKSSVQMQHETNFYHMPTRKRVSAIENPPTQSKVLSLDRCLHHHHRKIVSQVGLLNAF
jgi:hypothetical protein